MSESGRTIPAPPIASAEPVSLAEMTTEELARFLERGDAVALVPIGSTEPHGPHLPLSTDVLLSEEACRRAAITLRASGRPAIVAPGVPYGVTRYAAGFRGAIGVGEATLVALLVDVGRALLDDGFAHVAFVNNHLEPAHVVAIGKAVETLGAERGPERLSFPNQLGKRWGRTLTAEFKRGDCHAGCYETSLMMASRPELVHGEVARALPPVAVSLSDAIRDAGGKPVSFQELGMTRAYTGSPATASREEGEATFALLVDMIVTEVGEHLDVSGDTSRGTVPSVTPRGDGGPT